MNITKVIDNDELKKDIEEFTNKLKKQGCIHVKKTRLYSCYRNSAKK